MGTITEIEIQEEREVWGENDKLDFGLFNNVS